MGYHVSYVIYVLYPGNLGEQDIAMYHVLRQMRRHMCGGQYLMFVFVQVLYKFLRHNAQAINFWLENCVFPQEAKIFSENLRRTAWHLAETVTGKVRHWCLVPCPYRLQSVVHVNTQK